MVKPPDYFLLKEEPKNLLKVKQKSLIKSSHTRKDKTEISKTQDSYDTVTKETVQKINLSYSLGVNDSVNAEICGNVMNSSTQTISSSSNYDVIQAETDKIQDDFVVSRDYQTDGVKKYNQERINDYRRPLGLPSKQITKVENRKSSEFYSFCDGDVKESINQDNELLSCESSHHMTDPTCILQEGHRPTYNVSSDNVTVEELSSILLDVASNLGKAPSDVKKMVVSDMHPPETLKQFINTMTYLTEYPNYINEVGNPGVSSMLHETPIDEEAFESKHFYDDSETSVIGSKFISTKNKFSDTTCCTDTSIGIRDLNKKNRKKNSDVVNRIANMYYDTEFGHLKGGRKNKRKRLVTDRSEYILLKPNEIKNKIKKVMKKYIGSFEKFMEEEIQKQSSEENKFKDKSVSLSVEEKEEQKSNRRMISYCFLFFVIVSIMSAVGYSLFSGQKGFGFFKC